MIEKRGGTHDKYYDWFQKKVEDIIDVKDLYDYEKNQELNKKLSLKEVEE